MTKKEKLKILKIKKTKDKEIYTNNRQKYKTIALTNINNYIKK